MLLFKEKPNFWTKKTFKVSITFYYSKHKLVTFVLAHIKQTEIGQISANNEELTTKNKILADCNKQLATKGEKLKENSDKGIIVVILYVMC